MSDFDYAVLERTAHRPWPIPRAPWIMTQTWHDLLFAHWRVDVAAITTNTMTSPHRLALNGAPALVHFARRQDVVVWGPAALAPRDQRRDRKVSE